MRTVRRLLELTPRERILLVRALVCLVAVRCGLRLFSFTRVRWLLHRAHAAPLPAGCTASEIRWAVLAAARRLPDTRCLARALALQALLQKAAIASELRIGVARDGGGLRAHAWVECAGQPIFADEDISTYAPLSPLPLDSDWPLAQG